MNICCFIILNGILAAYGAICSNGPVMGDYLNFSMALPPSLIFCDTNFSGKTWCRTSVSVAVSNLVRICSEMAELSPINWFQMAAFAILDFCTRPMRILTANLSSASVSNSVQMCATNNGRISNYGQKCGFQYGGGRPPYLEFSSGVYFYHLVVFG